jgi:hypothetical protein
LRRWYIFSARSISLKLWSMYCISLNIVPSPCLVLDLLSALSDSDLLCLSSFSVEMPVTLCPGPL